jgi:hypothetical protein
VLDSLDPERLSEGECAEVFRRLFPLGLGGEDVLAELAPAGWERSPLLSVFHPSPEQVHRETTRIRRNLRTLSGPLALPEDGPEPTLDDVRATWHDKPVDRDRELRELVGRCVWDVCSDNHDVIAPDGRTVDIGSFRGAGDFIADLLNREIGESRYGYLDFYLGTAWISDRADLTPVYAMFFRRLARQGFEWTYTFPRLYAFDLGGEFGRDVSDTLDADRERGELHALLDDGHRDAIERAKDEPSPPTVAAYRQIYDRDPRGWPPWE